MNSNNEEKKKEGLLGAVARLFGGGGGGAGASSGLGSAAGAAGGLFASKAGILGVILGGATIAAGVGVVYNVMGPTSKPVYSPSLFQNAYQEEQAVSANIERQRVNSQAASEPSTLDMFSEQARKDGISMGGEGSGGSESAGGEDGSEAGTGASASADVAAPDAGGGSPQAGARSGKGKLAASLGFGSKGGAGSGTSIPKMNTSGGLSEGIGQKFSSVYRPPSGQASGMKGSVASRLSNSPKYTVPNFNKKGAFGQAKYAGKMGGKAAYAASDAGAHTSATEAFAGETTGTGDVAGGAETGAGLGGAGVTDGNALKANDPSLNSSEIEVPDVNEDDTIPVDPWQDLVDLAFKAMIASALLTLITKALSHFAKGVPWMYIAAMITAYAAIAAALVVVYAGVMMWLEHGQKWMGIMYIITGLGLAWAAYQALCGVGDAATANGADLGKMGGGCPNYTAPAGAGAGAGSAASVAGSGALAGSSATGGSLAGSSATAGDIKPTLPSGQAYA